MVGKSPRFIINSDTNVTTVTTPSGTGVCKSHHYRRRKVRSSSGYIHNTNGRLKRLQSSTKRVIEQAFERSMKHKSCEVHPY